MSSLVEKLIQDAPQYHLFQAMRLLEADSLHPKTPYKLSSAPALSFPASDLKNVYWDDRGILILESSYFGLYGVDGPLPAYLLQAAAADDEKGEVFRAFLDIFNHRFYTLLFQAWKRGRSSLFLENKNSRYKQHLESIAQSVSGCMSNMYPYAGLLGARVHSAEALRSLLQDYLKMPVSISQFIPVWMPVASIPSLGVNSILGDNMLLGTRVLDLSQKISIRIGPLKSPKAFQLLPNTNRYRSLCALIKQYLGHWIQFEIVLQVIFKNSHMGALGDASIQLGYSTWLGEKGTPFNCIRLSTKQ